MTTKIVKIGEMDVELAPPRSLTIMYELLLLESECTVRLRPWGAALGACWASGCRPQADITRIGGRDLALYGMMVFDELAERKGVTMEQLTKAGKVAMQLVKDAYFSKEDLEAVKGNSEGEEPPTE